MAWLVARTEHQRTEVVGIGEPALFRPAKIGGK
jgi:hypothetical protein